MKTLTLLLIAPLLACSQTPILLKPPVPVAAKLLDHVIENYTVPAAAVGTASFTYILAKQPAPGSLIKVGFYNSMGYTRTEMHFDPTQSAILQRTLVISLPVGQTFAAGDSGQISYDTPAP